MVAGIEQAVREQDRRVFVGRAQELALFERWLGSRERSALSVTGPGGVGKSELLAAFQRAALDAGRPVAGIDGAAIPPTPSAALAALGHQTVEEAAEALGADAALLVVDAFEALGPVRIWLRDELLPRLAPAVRVVIAGRHPPAPPGRPADRWPLALRAVPLERLTREASRTYLARRGLTSSDLTDQIVAACGGWPLALSLAADLVEQFGVRRLTAAPEWRLAMRELVEQLLGEAADPALREMLEACAVVRQFDEELLAALTGSESPGAFAALCRLSVVRPTPRGLALHDDVRRLVADDLRWRRPARHAELRLRALEHLRRRAAGAPDEEREHLLEERLFLWGNEVAQQVLYAGSEPGEVWIEPAGPADRAPLVELHRRWQEHVRPALGRVRGDAEWDPDAHSAWFADLVATPSARVHVARDRSDRILGYDVVLPVCEETMPVASRHAVIGTAIEAYLATEHAAPLAPDARSSDVRFLAHLGMSGLQPEATHAALVRDLLSVLARGGVVLCSLEDDEYRRLAQALGFRPLPGSQARFRDGEYLGHVLDLRRIGLEVWLRALLAGGPPPPTGPGELAEELRDVLAAWHDDRRVASSPLRSLTGHVGEPRAEPVRDLVAAALEHARATCPPAHEAALRAVELAYLDRAASHERAAETLHVSRATFYRRLHAGVDLLADAIPAAAAA
jgi:hypothetical protein